MFEASFVYFQCENERAAHVKIDHVSRFQFNGKYKYDVKNMDKRG